MAGRISARIQTDHLRPSSSLWDCCRRRSLPHSPLRQSSPSSARRLIARLPYGLNAEQTMLSAIAVTFWLKSTHSRCLTTSTQPDRRAKRCCNVGRVAPHPHVAWSGGARLMPPGWAIAEWVVWVICNAFMVFDCVKLWTMELNHANGVLFMYVNDVRNACRGESGCVLCTKKGIETDAPGGERVRIFSVCSNRPARPRREAGARRCAWYARHPSLARKTRASLEQAGAARRCWARWAAAAGPRRRGWNA